MLITKLGIDDEVFRMGSLHKIAKELRLFFVLHDDIGEVTEKQTDDDIRALKGNDCGR